MMEVDLLFIDPRTTPPTRRIMKFIPYTLSGKMTKKIESLSPDVLLLNNNLPDGMGWKAAKAYTSPHKHHPD
jgi:hypothetical protein